MDVNYIVHLRHAYELSSGTRGHSLGSIQWPEFSLGTRVVMPTAKATHSTRTEAVFLVRFYHLLGGQLKFYL